MPNTATKLCFVMLCCCLQRGEQKSQHMVIFIQNKTVGSAIKQSKTISIVLLCQECEIYSLAYQRLVYMTALFYRSTVRVTAAVYWAFC